MRCTYCALHCSLTAADAPAPACPSRCNVKTMAAARRRPMSVATIRFGATLWGFAQMMKRAARRHARFRDRLCERTLVAQIMARDEEVGRWFEVRGGRVRSRAGLHKKP